MSLQYAIKEVLNCTFYDFTTGNPLFYADYMSDSSIETKAQRLDLRGGQGNYKLVSFDHTKDMTFSGEMPLVDLNTVAMLTGKPLKIGAVTLPKRDVLTVNGSNQVTLTNTPLAGTLKIYILNGRDNGIEQTVGTPASTQNTYSIATGTSVTLNATSCPENTQVVATYSYTAPSTTSTTTFTADKFAGYVRIVGSGVVTDQVTGATVPTIFDIKKAKAQNDWTITQKSTDATKLQLKFDLYAVDISDGAGGIDKVYCTMSSLT